VRIAKNVVNEAAGAGSIERRMQNRTQVLTEV
jgi:hypothetical protein